MLKTKSCYRGAIIGTAIGDALGAPLETLTKQQIASQIPSSWTDFLDPETIKRPSGTYQHVSKAGQWTDDTQLMRPIIWSLIEYNRINPFDIAQKTLQVYEHEELRGWGRSTKASLENIRNGVPWFRASEGSHGTGNGVAMKCAPLGLYIRKWCFSSPRYEWSYGSSDYLDKLNLIISVGKITHNEIGIAAGFLQCILISVCYHYGLEPKKHAKDIVNILADYEKEYFGNTNLTDKLFAAINLSSIEDIANQFGTGCRADRSWVTTAAVFLRSNESQAIDNMFTLIKQGGDCDTTGAMYGALIGGKWGDDIFPKHLIDGVEGSEELLRLADKLYSTIGA